MASFKVADSKLFDLYEDSYGLKQYSSGFGTGDRNRGNRGTRPRPAREARGYLLAGRERFENMIG